MSDVLPNGWVFARLPDLIAGDGVFIDGDWVESKDQDANGEVRLIQLADIGDGFYVDKSNRFLTSEKALELNCTFLKTGDVLVARMPDPLGRACIFPGGKHTSVTVVDVCIIRGTLNHFDNRWLMHFINTPAFREKIYALQSGSTRKRISRGNFCTLQLPIPPRLEQSRIVEKLEQLLSDLDVGVAELKAAQKKLAQYRQSLLKAAVEGELTAEWRAERARCGEASESGAELLQRILKERCRRWEEKQLAKFQEQGKTPPKGWRDKYPEPVPHDATDLPDLPDGWVWASVDQCALDEAAITDGPFGSNLKSSHYQDTGPRVIRLQNVGDGVFVDARASISGAHYAMLIKHAVEENDLIVAMLGGILPRTCVIPHGVSPAIVKADCARVRLNCQLLKPAILNAQLNAQPTRDRVEGLVKGIGRPRINLGHIRAIPVALCSIEEQREVETVLIEAQQTIQQQLAAIDLSLKQAAAQRKNILKTAFCGQLVPQDQNDEPASVLLERVHAKRAEREKRRKRHKKVSIEEVA